MAAHPLRHASRHTGTALIGLLLLGAAGLCPATAQSVDGGVAGPVPKMDGSKPDVRVPRASAPPRAARQDSLQPSPMPDIAALPSAAPSADPTASADPTPGEAASGDAAAQAAIPRPAMSQPGPVASAPAPPADAAPDAPAPAADAQVAAAPMPKETEWLDTTPQVATAEPAPVPSMPSGPSTAEAPTPTLATRSTPSPMPDLPPPVVADIPRAPVATADAVMHIAHPALRDTATVVVDGKDVVLYGIDGYGGEDAAALEKYIAEVGGTLDCRTEQSDRHVCTLADGSDIAEVALANGIARVALGGPESYKAQETVAQNARRGLWGELPPLAPQFDHPTVPDTGTLRSPSGDVYRLDGIEGVAGPLAATIQAYILTHGDNAACQPQGPDTFVCLLPDQTDIAKLALVNGLAKAAPDALPEYRIEQDAAQINHRGIWASIDPAAVNLAQRDMAQQQAVILSFDSAQEGFSIIDGQPTLLVEGAPVFMVFAGAAGWGYWDRSHSWHGAPDRVAGRLEAMHPRGQGLRGWSNSGTRMAMASARPGEFGRGAPVGAGRPAGAGFGGAGRAGMPGGGPGFGGRPGVMPVGMGAGGRAVMPGGGMGMGGHPGMPPGGMGLGGHPGMPPGGMGVGGRPGMAPGGMGVGGRPGMPPGGMGVGGRPAMAPGGMGGMPGRPGMPGGMMAGRPGVPMGGGMGGGRPAMGAPAMAPRPPVMAARAPAMAPHPAAPAAPHRR